MRRQALVSRRGKRQQNPIKKGIKGLQFSLIERGKRGASKEGMLKLSMLQERRG